MQSPALAALGVRLPAAAAAPAPLATAAAKPESVESKLWRKVQEDPLVPIGCAVTAVILGTGFHSFVTGRKKRSQKLMRWRVVAQAATLVAVFVGVGLNKPRGPQRQARPADPEPLAPEHVPESYKGERTAAVSAGSSGGASGAGGKQ